MRIQGPHFLPFCASERDHFEILKYIAKGVGRKFSWGIMGKTRPKYSIIMPPSTLSVICMKLHGGHGPPAPDVDAHAYGTATHAYWRLIAV